MGQRVRGVNGCKGPGDGPVAAGSVGCVGLGQSARLKGTWVGSAVALMGIEGHGVDGGCPEGKGGGTHWRIS